MTSKRENVISWDEYFMLTAVLSSHRSKDPSTQTGACIVDQYNKIVGVGYNGFPIGCNDDLLPWASEGEYLTTKNPYVCHAELNAVLNATVSTRDCRIYVTLFPCNECAKVIIQAGIKEIVYLTDKGRSSQASKEARAAQTMLDLARIKYRKLEHTHNFVTLKLGGLNDRERQDCR